MKFFSFNRNHTAVLITLLFVLSIGAIYFFIYVPNTEKSLHEQRFRSLQNIERNIHEKILNSGALMNNLLKEPGDTGYIKFLSAQSRDLFSLSLLKSNIGKQANDSSYSVIVNNENRNIAVLLTKRDITSTDTTINYQVVITWSFKQFIESLLPKNVFDEYIILNEGEVIYETFPSGISYLNDSLLDKSKGIVSSGVKALNISGTDYKLFLQPVRFNSVNKWVITGLLSNKRYQQERSRLPAGIVILLVTVLLGIIVVYPWIKLYQMGNKDRLTITDGIASILVSMLLMSLLFFTLFKYNYILRPDNKPNTKDTLSSQITTAFLGELNTIYKKLNAFNDSAKFHPELFGNIINLDKDTISLTGSGRIPLLKMLKEIAGNISINQVFWLNGNGDEMVNWTSNSMNAPHGNYRKREYFRKIIQNKGYPAGEDPAHKFYLDQVISWVSGTFTSVLSIPSGIAGKPVAAISVNLNSINTPVLTPGYQFAIIDNSGKVLYHSDTARNLNENLIAEFSNNESLTSCLQASSASNFTTNYFSKEYDVSVRPIEKLPYFMVVLEDTRYRETRDMESYSFTFSMLLLFFAFLIFQLFIVFLVSSKRSFFRKQLFNTSWIGPKKYSHHEYNLSAITNVCIIFLAIYFFHLSSFLTYLFILVFSVTFTSIFLNSVFARRYKRIYQEDNFKFKISTLAWLFIFVIIIDIAAIRVLDPRNILLLLLYQILALTTGWIFYRYGTVILSGIKTPLSNNFRAKWNYTRSFPLMALTRLVITSGIPVVFFYVTSYDYEQNISMRYRQLQYANNLIETFSNKPLDTIIQGSGPREAFYYEGGSIKEINIKDAGAMQINSIPILKYSPEEEVTAKLLRLFRINITENSIKEANFFTTHGTDTLFFFNPLLKDACKNDSATKTYRKTSVPGQYLTITAAKLNYKVPSLFGRLPLSGLLFWTIFCVALITFYFIIYNIVVKLFCLGLPNLSVWDTLGDQIISDSNINKWLFIIGLPGSGKLSIILSKIKNGTLIDSGEPLVYKEDSSGNVCIADLINIPDFGDDGENDARWKALRAKVDDQRNKLIIVNHFEYNISDSASNRIKLDFLQDLMLKGKCKIIILSTIHPTAFLESLKNQPEKGAEKSEQGQDLEKWHVLLGHFSIIVYPLLEWELKRGKPLEPGYKKIYKEIYKETKYTLFLGKIHQYAVDRILKDLKKEQADKNADELALKLQVTAHYFYMYIWQSLTKEEKFLLYDLAEDNLVNSFDDYNLNMLLAKGVIIRPDGTLRLFNKGFRNFILTAIGNSEASKIQNTINDNGNWNRLKNPLLILALAILAFLLTSQQETYSRLIAYVAALATGVPTILKLFSIFDKSGQKNS